MTRLIIPNYHVILIHYPLAMLGMGLLVEILSFMWRRSSFRFAGQWMILLGALSLFPAATSGIYALFDVANHGDLPAGAHWVDVKATSRFDAADWDVVRNHVLYNSLGAAVALIAVVIWLGSSDRSRSRLYLPLMVVLIAAMGLVVTGAWHGGEMVFREGFGVKGVKGVYPAGEPTAGGNQWTRENIENAIQPLQLHLMMAGLVFAISAAAIGLSFRKSVVGYDLLVEKKPIEDASADLIASPAPGESGIQPISITPVYNEPGQATVVSSMPPRVAAGRFWLLAALFALLTIAGGLYVGGYIGGQPLVDAARFQDTFKKVSNSNDRRSAAHVVFGVSILVLTLVLGGLSKFAMRHRISLWIFSSLLVLVMAAQVWIGILMLYDSDEGPLTNFSPAGTQPGVPMSMHHE